MGRDKQQPVDAFTLLELLVAVAIIALLMTISLSGAAHVRQRTRNVLCASNLPNVGQLLHAFVRTHADFPACTVNMPPARAIWPCCFSRR